MVNKSICEFARIYKKILIKKYDQNKISLIVVNKENVIMKFLWI